MKRIRTASSIIDAKEKEAGISSIDENLNFGDGLSVESLRNKISEAEILLEQYNASISNADAIKSKYYETLTGLRNLTHSMMKGVESKFGADSIEYGKAGGVRTSLRKHPKRKPSTAA